VVAIAAGSSHSLALKANGTVVVWGYEPTGNVIPPSGLNNAVGIAATTWHDLALRADGTVVAWGADSHGETQVPPGLTNVTAIAAGLWHSMALRSDGTISVWGYGGYSLTNVPPELTHVLAISSGDYHWLALSPSNVRPCASANVAVGGINRDLVVSLGAWDPNGGVPTLRLSSLPVRGALYHYTATGRGSAITTPGTPVEDPGGRVIFAPEPDSFDAPYTTFSFIANNGLDDSAPGVITVHIVPPPQLQAPRLVQDTNSMFNLSFAGLPNAPYTVWVSTNLVNWSYTGPATQASPGLFTFTDIYRTNWAQRFYRLRSP
jgi:hypothetical protein